MTIILLQKYKFVLCVLVFSIVTHNSLPRPTDDVTMTVTYREILDLRESPATDSTVRDPRLRSAPAECTTDPRLELGFILRVQLVL